MNDNCSTGLNEKLGTSSLVKCHMKQSWQETQVSVPGQGQDEETDKLTDLNERQEDESYLDDRTKRNSTATDPC